MNLRRVTAIISALVLVFFGSIINAGAASTNGLTSNGLSISPVRTDLTIAPGQSKTVLMYITNPANEAIKVRVIANDFKPVGQSGSPQLILGSDANNAHGLARFIEPVNDFTVPAGQQGEVKIVINIPKNTPGGGYYAAIRFAPTGLNSSSNLTLSANVASLILVKVTGPGLKQQLSVSGFNVTQDGNPGNVFFSPNNIKVNVGFSNSGNVQEAPLGKIEVLSGNKILSVQQINNPLSPGNVLPGSIRQFSTSLKGLGSFGKYNIEGFFSYGNNSTILTASKTVYVIASWFILIIIVFIVLIVLAILYWLIRRHKNRIQSQGS